MSEENLIRLTYASTSASSERGGGTAIDPRSGASCAPARSTTRATGSAACSTTARATYSRCWRAPEAEVKAPHDRIARDPRHLDVRTLERRPIGERRFPDWSMKHVPIESDVNQVLTRHRLPGFDPYQFDQDVIEDTIAVLVGAKAPEQEPDQDYRKGGIVGAIKRAFGAA